MSSKDFDLAFAVDKKKRKVNFKDRNNKVGSSNLLHLPKTEQSSKSQHSVAKKSESSSPSKQKKSIFALNLSETLQKSCRTARFEVKVKEQSVNSSQFCKESDSTQHNLPGEVQNERKLSKIQEKRKSQFQHKKRKSSRKLSDHHQTALACFKQLRAEHRAEQELYGSTLNQRQMHRLKKILQTEETKFIVNVLETYQLK